MNVSFLRFTFVAGLCLCVAVSSVPLSIGADSEDYSLFVEPGDTAVNIVSGNFSAAVTRDWPRVIFWHTTDMFGPTFEVGFPRMYIYNDSDGNGVFSRSEATGTVYLDSLYTVWNMTALDEGTAPDSGVFARFGMTSKAPCYVEAGNDTEEIHDWAEVSFWFTICENQMMYQNSRGEYSVRGKTELRANFTVELKNCSDCSGVVLEQSLQGGGSTNMFLLKETVADNEVNYTEVSGTVDQTPLGANFTNVFNATDEPLQEIQFSKEDGTVQALYLWNSEADSSNATEMPRISSSYYTTGTGMVLHTAISANNSTTLSHDSVVGIVESGFIGKITDWAKEHMVELATTATVLIAIVVLMVVVTRRRRARSNRGEKTEPDKKDDSMGEGPL